MKKTIYSIFILLLLISCKRENSGTTFPENMQTVWQYNGYHSILVAELNSYHDSEYRLYMLDSWFGFDKDIEVTLNIFINNNWISMYKKGESDVKYIWLEDERNIEDLKPKCEESI